MDNSLRIITCAVCGGDKGHMNFDGRWERCPACEGEGEFEVELQPIEMEDLDEQFS